MRLHFGKSAVPLYVLAALCLVAGAALRVAAFRWNDRLQGDVNLFALTAREFARNGRFDYPMKYEYSDHVAYRALHSPASQHPPLWPLLGGAAAKLSGTDDTFAVLKLMSEAVGFLTIAAVGFGLAAGARGSAAEKLAALSCVALSPMLVDFSANGSLYALAALVLVAAAIVLGRFDYAKTSHYLAAGVLSGAGFMVHGVLVSVAGAFIFCWLVERRRVRLKGLVVFVASVTVVLAPWVLWNLRNFGRPFYSYATLWWLNQIHLVNTGIYGDVITTRPAAPALRDLASSYAYLVGGAGRGFLRTLVIEAGPFCLTLAAVGLVEIFRRGRSAALALVSPFAVASAVAIFWGASRQRHVILALPLAYMAAATGFGMLYRGSFVRRAVGVALLAGTLLWGIPQFFEKVPTRYYRRDERNQRLYGDMRSLAAKLSKVEPGVVLGYSESLDGGIETVYWTDFPFVYGRGFGVDEVRKLVMDFDVRYVWTDDETREIVAATFPGSQVILANKSYFVYRLHHPDDPRQ